MKIVEMKINSSADRLVMDNVTLAFARAMTEVFNSFFKHTDSMYVVTPDDYETNGDLDEHRS